jgi:pyruvate/2-oxoglutarate dehydrogenase complex dihydrolipoamide dehydrogenase (E3) component
VRLEVALASAGVRTTLVELAPHVPPPLEEEPARYATHALTRLGIDVRTGVATERIDAGPDEDVVVLAGGTRLAADLGVLSVGVRPDGETFERAGVTSVRGAILADEQFDSASVSGGMETLTAVAGMRALAGPERVPAHA